MTNADKKIIKDNPETSPYDLLIKKGLSQAGYDELIKASDDKDTNALKAGPVRQASHPLMAQPATSIYSENVSGTATLLSLTLGTSSVMSRTQAEKMARKYPKQFKVI